MKKYLIVVSVVTLGVLPILSLAQTAPLVVTPAAPVCMDFSTAFPANLASASDPATQIQILNLQLALSNEGLNINPAELGKFGKSTRDAVVAFQEKYAEDVLAPFGMKYGTGYPGTITRLKLQALYGCRTTSVVASMVPAGTNVSIQVANLSLDSNGVSATICNNGKSDLPTVPFRIRLNGINRDFEAVGAQKAGLCTSDSWKYETWGLSYDPGTTFTAISLIDPNGVYKTDKLQYASSASTTVSVPAVPGYHLSVRSMLLKSGGLQATFCNLGTQSLTSFPVNITVNGTTKSFDIPEVYPSGKCQAKQWTYDNWGIVYQSGMIFTATISVDPNNTYKETNEFDNVATAVGTL
jgi:hypothetical protein